jgi:SRSO17 transposase
MESRLAAIPLANSLGVGFRSKWQLALELIDEARAWGLRGRVVLADAAYGEVTEFRVGLEARQQPYVVGIASSLGVWTKPARRHKLKARGRGRPPTVCHYGDQRPLSVRQVAEKARGWKQVRWREGTKGWLESRFYACRVQPSHGFNESQPPHKEV